jgi:hypothetical protein
LYAKKLASFRFSDGSGAKSFGGADFPHILG